MLTTTTDSSHLADGLSADHLAQVILGTEHYALAESSALQSAGEVIACMVTAGAAAFPRDGDNWPLLPVTLRDGRGISVAPDGTLRVLAPPAPVVWMSALAMGSGLVILEVAAYLEHGVLALLVAGGALMAGVLGLSPLLRAVAPGVLAWGYRHLWRPVRLQELDASRREAIRTIARTCLSDAGLPAPAALLPSGRPSV